MVVHSYILNFPCLTLVTQPHVPALDGDAGAQEGLLECDLGNVLLGGVAPCISLRKVLVTVPVLLTVLLRRSRPEYLVVHLLAGVGAVRALPPRALRSPSEPLLAQPRLVVLPPSLLVTEHVVGLSYQGEHLTRVQSLVGLRMELLGHVEVCDLDVR